MGTRRGQRRKPKRVLPKTQEYVRPPAASRYWRLGGSITRGHEDEARRALAAKRPGRVGRLVLRLLGWRSDPPP